MRNVLLLGVAVALHARGAAAEAPASSPEHDTDEMPAILAPAPRVAERTTDVWDLPIIRADGGLGFGIGDGPSSFAARGHVGVSYWLLERENDPSRRWRAGLRLSTGIALGMDFSGHQRAFPTAAPFVEIGLALATARDDDHAARQAAVFARAEPVLVLGALHERALRIGAGFSLHGYDRQILGGGERRGNASEQSEDELMQTFVSLIGAPILAAINLHYVEVTTDIGEDGRAQYGVLVGFWAR